MTEQDQDPTTPEPAPPAEPPEAPVQEKARRRPTRGQLLVAGGALVGVLAVASLGFAVGRATAGDHRPDHPGFGQRFDDHGPGMMPPGLPGYGGRPGMPQAPDDDSDDEDSNS